MIDHGQYRQSIRIHLLENTVDIDGRCRFTYEELRSIVDRRLKNRDNFVVLCIVYWIKVNLKNLKTTLINHTRLRTKGQSAGYPQAQIEITSESNSSQRRAPQWALSISSTTPNLLTKKNKNRPEREFLEKWWKSRKPTITRNSRKCTDSRGWKVFRHCPANSMHEPRNFGYLCIDVQTFDTLQRGSELHPKTLFEIWLNA